MGWPQNRSVTLDIAYANRSEFLEACENGIRAQRAQLDAGGAVDINLKEGGYGGEVVVTIRPNDRTSFGSDWEGADPTRFPARIKAAATALLRCGCDGRFKIWHSNGSLTVRAA